MARITFEQITIGSSDGRTPARYMVAILGVTVGWAKVYGPSTHTIILDSSAYPTTVEDVRKAMVEADILQPANFAVEMLTPA